MTLAAVVALGGLPPGAQAQVLPSGGSLVRGQARIGTPNGQSLTIQQGTARAVIDWSRFDIGAGAQVNIVQPGSGAALLNRVSGQAASTVAGQLNANGQVFLVNPNGIAITPTGTVQVGGGFVASTLDIGNDDFMAGRLQFAGDTGVLTHAGRIDTGDGGFAALLGQRVDNSGSLVVPLGRAGLGAGRRITLDLQGDGFLQVSLPANPLGDDPVVQHRGRIQADGGLVHISAASARQAVRQVVNLSGVVEARSVSGRSGAIVLGGGEGSVALSGRLDTGSADGQGGQITVTGRDIALQGATLQASGASGGGSIRIGGERHGGGTLQRAQSTTLDAASTVKADATASGDGGEVVVWADGRTAFAGRISARGAGAAGNGGEAEVSGRTHLTYTGQTDLRAADNTRSGRTGHLLLDPYDVTISSAADTGAGFTAGADDTVINTTTLQNALATASVTISTGSGGTQSGQITVASPLSWSANTTLTLDAAAGVAVNAGITHSGASSGLVLQAAGSAGITGSGALANGGALSFNQSHAGANSTYAGAISGAGSVSKAGAGALSLGGSNSYSGTTSVQAGTLQLTGSGSLGTGSIDLASGATLLFNTSAYNNSGPLLSSSISGAGTLQVAGAAATKLLRISADLTGLSGVFQVDVGARANLHGSNRGSASAAFVVNGLLATQTTGVTYQLGSLAGSGSVSQGGGSTNTVLEIGANGQSTTFSGNIGNCCDSTSVKKLGTGTWSLTGTMTYTGTTTISAGTLQVGNGGTTGALRNGAIINNGTLSFNRSNALSVANAISGSGALTKSGAGTLTLTGANTYSGGSTLSAGAVVLGSGTGTLGSGTVTLAGGHLALNPGLSGSTYTYANPINVTANSTIASDDGLSVLSGAVNIASGVTLKVGTAGWAGKTLTLSGHLSGAGALTIQGNGLTVDGYGTSTNGQVHLSGSNSYQGATAVTSGTVTAGSTGAFSAASAFTTSTGVVLDLAGHDNRMGSLTGWGTITNDGAAVATLTTGGNNASTTFGGVMQDGSAAFALAKTGSGTLSLSGASSYFGTTAINQGALKIIGSGWLGGGSYSGLSVASGSSFEYSSSATQTLTSISGAGTVTHSGSGTLTLSGTPSLTGIYNLNGPTTLSGASDLAKSGLGYASAVNIGGYVTLAGGNNSFLGFQGDASANTVVTLNAGGTLYNPGATIHLTNGITFNGGTLASGPTNSTFAAYGSYTVDKAVTVTADSTASALSLALNSGGGVDVVVSPGATLTVSGTIDRPTFGGGAGLRLQGGGTLVLQQANSFTGATWVEAGTLRLGHAGALAASSAVTVNGTLDLGGQAAAVGSLAGSGSVTNSAVGAARLAAGSSGASTTFSGVIQDGASSVALTKAGSGTLTLSGGHSYSGTTTVDGGTLALSGSWDRSGATATVAVAAGATLSGAGTLSASTLQLSGAGTVHLSGSNAIDHLSTSGTLGALSVNNAASLSVGAITSTGPITLSTTGASADLILSQALHSDASGNAVVLSAGRRFVNQAGSSALTTGTGGRFLIYSNDWDADTLGGLSAGHLYNRSYANDAPGTIAQAGSQLIYRRQPLLTVTALDASRVYGDANPLLSASVTGLVNGDSAAGAYSGSAVLNTSAGLLSGVGSYAISPGAGTLASAQGYGFTYVPATLSVTPRAITVSAGAHSRVYGDANPALGYTVGGFGLVNGDTLSGALSTAATAASNVGSYAIAQGTLAASSNYRLSYTANALTVTPRAITVMADAHSRVYGDANPALGYTVGGSGLVNGDTLAGSLATAAGTTAHVGRYGITQGTLAASPNYLLSYSGNELVVTPRLLTVAADAHSRYQGDPNPPLTYSVGGAGLVNGDSLSGAQSTSAGAQALPGSYAIAQGTLSASANYQLSYAPATMTVRALPTSRLLSARTVQVSGLDCSAPIDLPSAESACGSSP